jgi:uncharacterized protein involved in exopolysaccharide biosynthesis
VDRGIDEYRNRSGDKTNIPGDLSSGSQSPVTETGITPVTTNRFELNLFELGQLLIRERKWIFRIVIPVVLLVAVKMFLTPNVYKSHAVILPSGLPDKMGALEELVGISGVSGMLSENSSVYYPLILQSNLIRDSVLSQVYDITFKGKRKRVILSEYFGQEDPNRLRKYLGDITEVSSNKRTKEIHISVETKYPELSQAILAEYLEQLEKYNRFTRKSSAKENQRYLEKRLVVARRELAQAEEALREFREKNSNWANTTNAVILRDLQRLQRDVEIKTKTYTFLEQQLEMAKFEAQKDVPIVRILDQPSLPTIKSGPKRIITIFFAGVIAFAIVVVGIIFNDLWRQVTSGRNRQTYSSFRQDLVTAFPRSTRVLRMIKRVSRGQVRQSSDKVEA